MQKVLKASGKYIGILIKFLPFLSFIIPFIVLYSLYPKSFEGDPGWEGTWQGRFLYIFFLWLAILEMILSWEKLTNKVNKLKSIRTIAFIAALLLPTMYVAAANYRGLNIIIADIAKQSGVTHSHLIPLVTEYLVFATLFCLIILLAFGMTRLTDFSISIFFLGIIGLLYIIDDAYPVGRFTPFQIFTQPTATLAANVLNLMGYRTRLASTSDPSLGFMPTLIAWNSQGKASAKFAIAWPCAGVESFLIYTVTILLFLKKSSISSYKRIAYFIIGAVITYFVNILRVVSIVIVSINGGDVMRFHNIYGPLYSITWIMAYPLIIIGTRALWGRIRSPKSKMQTAPFVTPK